MSHATLWLSNGKKIVGLYDGEDFDGLFEDWDNGNIMGFKNCCVRGKDVVLIEYPDDEIEAPLQSDKGEYKIFNDPSYYDMWCVRNTNDKRFESPMSFHFAKKDDALRFKYLIELAK